MGRVDGRVAIVTGAAQGIGAAYAKALAAEGAKLVLADVLDCAPGADIIRQAGGEALALTTDVTDDASLEAMVAATLEQFGRIDVAVTNAAIFGKLKLKPFDQIGNDEWDALSRVNIRGVWQTIKAVTPQMRKQKYGKIINIASGTAFKGVPGFAHYVASKGAVIALTRALARELGDDNICVNCIAPGLTMSEGVRSGDHGRGDLVARNTASRCFQREEEPEDLTGALLFFASADSDFITGQTLLVDGGSAMH